MSNLFQYNEKELQDELNLGWLDYGWREFDPTISRWVVIDGHSESYYTESPYVYCINNPINLKDLLGLDPVYRDGKYYDNGKEVSWDYVTNWVQNNNGVAVTYHFDSKPGSKTSPISKTEENSKGNDFYFNKQKYTANSLVTLAGRDDGNN